MVPFFVVDRPISLKIIQGLKIPRGKKIGLMAHANTSPNFRRAFRAYPHRQVIKMCDSAIFNLGGYKSGYADLFALYEEMGTDYGVMIDVFRNSHATLESARKALAAYDPKKHHFQLVAVAQGKTVEEYLDCYRQLRSMGFKYIAVGGLLQKVARTARYTRVRDENLMRQVLRRIREEFDPEWLFALGCLHPSRLQLFQELDVWGDYKGWIFEYKKRDESLCETIKQLTKNHLEHASPEFRRSAISEELKKALAQREQTLRLRSQAQKDLLTAKKNLRDFMAGLSRGFGRKQRELARVMEPLRARGLLEISEKGRLMTLLRETGGSRNLREKLIALAQDSRLHKNKLLKVDEQLNACNERLLSVLRRVKRNHSTDSKLRKTVSRILEVLETTEQKHRIRQVRVYIEERILNELH